MASTADTERGTAGRRIEFVNLPPTVDIGNDRIVLDSLTSALARRPSVLVADATAMAFCDCAGVSVLVCAHKRAADAGAQLRVVTPSAAVRRIIWLARAHEVLDVYRTIDEALAGLAGSDDAPPLAVAAPARDSEERT